MSKIAIVLVSLVLGSAAFAAAGAGPAPDNRPCYAAGFQGDIAANQQGLSAIETQIKAVESQQTSAKTQLEALNPEDPVGGKQRMDLQRQYDSGVQHIAQLEDNAKLMRGHITDQEAKATGCSAKQSASP